MSIAEDRLPEATRGREASRALTEIRTVLSRAETARDSLDQPTEYHRSVYDPSLPDMARPKYEDPDAAEMRAALDEVIELLLRWRKTGRTRTATPLA